MLLLQILPQQEQDAKNACLASIVSGARDAQGNLITSMYSCVSTRNQCRATATSNGVLNSYDVECNFYRNAVEPTLSLPSYDCSSVPMLYDGVMLPYYSCNCEVSGNTIRMELGCTDCKSQLTPTDN